MLKALELAGFKSFADRTRFEFHEGVTVVVGPNGSGKSNVVDAIKWVLGSQSPKSLRGTEMTDVIFNGSTSRSALNMAEVTLVLDNREGAYGGTNAGPEVAITRRVYRSGEGEYLINGAACRLRDIRDLLAGTGIGTEAYSIIEQGKVDALLQASPRDRRAIFEEAAGISRFRAKRQDAARRLARVDQNLLRLSDIVDEVESRLRSVRMQAGKAQRYREGVKRLKELRTQIGIADWFRLTKRIDNVADELESFHSNDAAKRDWLQTADEELTQLAEASAEAEQKYERADSQVVALREKVVGYQATLEGLAARKEDLEANLTALDEQQRAVTAAPSATEPDRQSQAAKLQVTQSDYEAASRALADATQRLREHEQAVERLSAQVAEIDKRLGATRHRCNLLNQKLTSTAERRSSLGVQQAERITDAERLEQQLTELKSQVEQLNQQHTAANRDATASESELEQGRRSLADSEQRLANIQRESQRAETDLAANRHRLELIGELDRENQANSQQVRDFMASTFGIQPLLVADVLNVDRDTASVIEAALGALAEYAVIPSSANLLDHAAQLPAGARLIRLDWRTPVSAIDQLDLSGEPGVWGRADQFVDSEAAYQPLIRRLLGRTWIVDSLRTADHLSHSVGPGLHFVTADGDLLRADGTLVIGRRERVRVGHFRRQNVEDLQAQIAALAERVEQLASEQVQLESLVGAKRQQVADLVDVQRRAVEHLATIRERLAALTSQHEGVQNRHRQVTISNEELDRQLDDLRGEMERTESATQALQEQCDKLDTRHLQLCSNLEKSLQTREDARQRESELQLDTAKLEHQVEVLVASLEQAGQMGPSTDLSGELERQRDSLLKRQEELATERESLGLTLDRSQSELELLAKERDELQASSRKLIQRHKEVQQGIQNARRQLDETQTRRSQLELAHAKLEHQRESLVQRLREDYQIDLPKVASGNQLDQSEIDRQQVEAEIEQIRDGLHRIGAVNVDALEELEEIENRFEAISAQYNDLSEAKASLERLMAKLNSESRQLFLSTVETVRGHFQELFRRLFGGGEADILLEESESDDALECGVEIRACPPGKETRTISLLSGGEKTLTCVALLLAMFRSKPSPFCVLDEVDAALDEANIGRFTGVLSDFLIATQFVVITHSKKTMTGANTLYGVTMQESGISKQVSVRFDDVTEDGFIKPSASQGTEQPSLKKAA